MFHIENNMKHSNVFKVFVPIENDLVETSELVWVKF